MKKAIALIILALAVAFGVAVMAAADDSELTLAPDEIEMKSADGVGVLTEGNIEFRFTFYIDAESVDKLYAVDANARVFAVIVDYRDGMDIKADSGIAVDLTKGDVKTVHGERVYEYTLILGGITEENAKTPVGVRGFVSYASGGEQYTVASDFDPSDDVIIPFENVYNAYCEKSYEDGTDENTIRTFLAAHLSVKLEDGKAYDELENDKYQSLYELEYFDGVLTVSIKGGDIPDWLISTLSINGTERYFEIYNGRIRLVV